MECDGGAMMRTLIHIAKNRIDSDVDIIDDTHCHEHTYAKNNMGYMQGHTVYL